MSIIRWEEAFNVKPKGLVGGFFVATRHFLKKSEYEKVCESLQLILPNNIYSIGPMRMSGLQLIEYAAHLDKQSKEGQDIIKGILDKKLGET